ncbi:MAG: hypothetical protein V4717_08160 [Bacteroidota bacterium]
MTQLPGKARLIMTTILCIVVVITGIYSCIIADRNGDDMQLFMGIITLPGFVYYTISNLLKLKKLLATRSN